MDMLVLVKGFWTVSVVVDGVCGLIGGLENIPVDVVFGVVDKLA